MANRATPSAGPPLSERATANRPKAISRVPARMPRWMGVQAPLPATIRSSAVT
ncbi:MAG: hypothetical protein ACRDI0_03630 [Actinomycetota bacterium]